MNTIFTVQTILSLSDMLSGPLTRVQSKINSTQKTAQSFSDRMGVLAKQMTVFAAIAGSVLFGVGSSVGAAADFQAAISRVGAVSGASYESMELLRSKALELGKTTAFTAVQAAQGQEKLAMAGFEIKQINDAMPGVLSLASAATEDLGNTANIASNIMGIFNINASDMNDVADKLTRTFTSSNTTLSGLGQTMSNIGSIAREAGTSLSEVSALAGTLGNVGNEASVAGTHIKIMYNKLMAPNAMAVKALRNLGVKTIDRKTGNLLPVFKILKQLDTALSGKGTGVRGALLKNIFGADAIGSVTSLFSAGIDNIARYSREIETGIISKKTINWIAELTNKPSEEIQKNIVTAAGVANRQLDNLNGRITLLSSAWVGLKITIGTIFLPVAELFVTILTKIVSLFSLIASHPVGKWLLMFATTMSVIVIGVTAFAAGWAAITGAIAIVTPMIGTLCASVGALFWPVTLVVAGVTALYVAWTSNFLGIRDITKNVFNSIKNFFTNINWYELGSNILSTLTDGIKSAIDKPYDAVKSVFSKVSKLFSFSDAKEGPLSTLTMNGRNILATMAVGIEQQTPEFERTIQQSLMFSTPEITTIQTPRSDDKQTVFSVHIDRIDLPGVSDGQSFVDDLYTFVRAHAVNI